MRFDQVTYEASYGTFKQLPKSTLPEVCFSGRSNVGKSSLINKILNRKQLARVSSQPGKTITINFYKGDGIKLVDLPGYGYAKASNAEKDRWGQMINGYFTSDRNIPLVVQLIDMRHKPSKDDLQMLQFLMETSSTRPSTGRRSPSAPQRSPSTAPSPSSRFPPRPGKGRTPSASSSPTRSSMFRSLALYNVKK